MSRNQRRKKRSSPSRKRRADPTASSAGTAAPAAGPVHHRPSTETRPWSRTTEFIAYAGAVLAVVITALAVDADGRGGDDPFGAESALRCIALLTIGYVLARGLAKSGSHRNGTGRAAGTGDDTRTDDGAPAPDAQREDRRVDVADDAATGDVDARS